MSQGSITTVLAGLPPVGPASTDSDPVVAMETKPDEHVNPAPENGGKICVVCSEPANGVYFGAVVCLPCKSFYIRCTKDTPNPTFTCVGSGDCPITKESRLRCQNCRFNKCLQAGMCRREKPEVVLASSGQELCRVCNDIANGLHFGIYTCEGCKKFFRRGLNEADQYECTRDAQCPINPRSRNTCRYCRYQKCLRVGMSRAAIKMGRPKRTHEMSAPQPSVGVHTTVQMLQRQYAPSEAPTLTGIKSVPTPYTSSQSLASAQTEETVNYGEQNYPMAQVSSSQSKVEPNPASHSTSINRQNNWTLAFTRKPTPAPPADVQNDLRVGTENIAAFYAHDDKQSDVPVKNDTGSELHLGVQSSVPVQTMNGTAFCPDIQSGTLVQTDNGTAFHPDVQSSPLVQTEHGTPFRPVVSTSAEVTGAPYAGSIENIQTFDLDDMDEFLKILNKGKHSTISSQSMHHLLEAASNNQPTQDGVSFGSTDTQLGPYAMQHDGTVPSHGNNLQSSPSTGNFSVTADKFAMDIPQKTMCPDYHASSFNAQCYETGQTNTNPGMYNSHVAPTQSVGDTFLGGRDHENALTCGRVAQPGPSQSSSRGLQRAANTTGHISLHPRPMKESVDMLMGQKGLTTCDQNAALANQDHNGHVLVNGLRHNQHRKREGTTESASFAKLFRRDYWDMAIDLEDISELTQEQVDLLSTIQKGYEQMVLLSDESISDAQNSIKPKPGEPYWKFVVKKRIIRNTKGAIAYAHQIPGFSELKAADQFYLCRYGGFHMMIILASREQFDPKANNFKYFWNNDMAPNNPGYAIKQDILAMARQLHALKLDMKEASCLGSMALISPDWQAVLDRGRLTEIGTPIRKALFSYIIDKHGHGIGRDRLREMLSIMPRLREIAIAHGEYCEHLKFQIDADDLSNVFTGISINT